jgi:hypothetical protein
MNPSGTVKEHSGEVSPLSVEAKAEFHKKGVEWAQRLQEAIKAGNPPPET